MIKENQKRTSSHWWVSGCTMVCSSLFLSLRTTASRNGELIMAMICCLLNCSVLKSHPLQRPVSDNEKEKVSSERGSYGSISPVELNYCEFWWTQSFQDLALAVLTCRYSKGLILSPWNLIVTNCTCSSVKSSQFFPTQSDWGHLSLHLKTKLAKPSSY